MPYDLFWFGCPKLFFSYEDAYRDKIKIQDTLNWQLGMYVQQAVASCLDRNCKYPEEPIFAGSNKKKPTMMEKFQNMMDAVNQKFR